MEKVLDKKITVNFWTDHNFTIVLMKEKEVL